MDLLSKHTQFQSKPFILFSILVVFSLFWKNKCRAIFCFKREWASVSYFQKLSNYLEWRYYALKLSLTVGRVFLALNLSVVSKNNFGSLSG